jgi:hypothetical protein
MLGRAKGAVSNLLVPWRSPRPFWAAPHRGDEEEDDHQGTKTPRKEFLSRDLRVSAGALSGDRPTLRKEGISPSGPIGFNRGGPSHRGGTHHGGAA